MFALAARRTWSYIGEAFVLQVVAVVLLLLLHSFLTNLLGAEQYGIINYAIIVASLLSLVTSLGLPNATLKIVAEYNENHLWGLLKGILIRSFQLILLVSVAVGLLMILVSHNLPLSSDLVESITYAALFLPFTALGLWRAKAIRGLHRIRESILPEEIVKPIVFLVMCLLFLLLGTKLLASHAAYLYVLASFLSLVLGVWWLIQYMPQTSTSAVTQFDTMRWTKTSIPMMQADILQALMNRADVLLLGVLVGMELTGIYSVAARIALLNVFVLKVIDIVVAPQIAASFHTGDRRKTQQIIKKGIIFSTVGAAPLFLLMILVPEMLLGIFGAEFRGGADVLRILAVGQLINAMTGPVGHSLLMTGHERLFAKVVTLFAVFNLLANTVAIMLWGMMGAAIATTLSVAGMNIMLTFFMRQKIYSCI